MKANPSRSLTAFSFSVLVSLSTTLAADVGVYGSAPASLDYPASSLEKKNARELELNSLSPTNPFPHAEVAPIDPITRQRVDGVKIGPAFRAHTLGSNYDYYRYVTFYNIAERKERFTELMIQRALCYEKSEIFANYTSTTTFSATVNATLSVKALGLSTTLTKSTNLGTGHGVTATGSIVADYIPNIIFQDWRGSTFIQMLDSKTGRTAFLDKPRADSPWWVFAFAPLLAKEKYPMDFEVLGAEKTFLVDRNIISSCDTSFGAR